MQGKVSPTWVAVLAFGLSSLFIGQSLADDAIPSVIELANSPDSPSFTPGPTPSAGLTTEFDAAHTPEPAVSGSATLNPTNDASPSPFATNLPAHAIANQGLFLRSADAVRVDPRANSAFVTPIQLNTASFVLACISSSRSILDISEKNVVNGDESALLAGDLSNELRVSGSSTQVMSVINSYNGLRAVSKSQGIAFQHLLLRFVTVSEPTVDPSLCNDGNPSNTRIISFVPFEIDIDMKKADVRLAR